MPLIVVFNTPGYSTECGEYPQHLGIESARDFVALLKKGPIPSISLNQHRILPHQHNQEQIVLVVSPNKSDGFTTATRGEEKLKRHEFIPKERQHPELRM
jgi:hypothetical protein